MIAALEIHLDADVDESRLHDRLRRLPCRPVVVRVGLDGIRVEQIVDGQRWPDDGVAGADCPGEADVGLIDAVTVDQSERNDIDGRRRAREWTAERSCAERSAAHDGVHRTRGADLWTGEALVG